MQITELVHIADSLRYFNRVGKSFHDHELLQVIVPSLHHSELLDEAYDINLSNTGQLDELSGPRVCNDRLNLSFLEVMPVGEILLGLLKFGLALLFLAVFFGDDSLEGSCDLPGRCHTQGKLSLFIHNAHLFFCSDLLLILRGLAECNIDTGDEEA